MDKIKYDELTHTPNFLKLCFYSVTIIEDELLKNDDNGAAPASDGNINLVSAGVSKMQVDEVNKFKLPTPPKNLKSLKND